MNLIWHDDFLAQAESGNFSRAAEQRHKTQPAFSRRIRALEDWLGVALFDRTSQPATLTEAGEWFRAVAGDLRARVTRIPDEARAVAGAGAGTLRIAATHALSFSFLPAWLRRLESQLSLGPVQLMSDVMQQCEVLMQQGRAQFLLCHAHPSVPTRLDPLDYPSMCVGADTLLPVCASDGAGRPRFSLDAPPSDGVPILAYSAGSGIGRLLQALLRPRLDAVNARSVFTAHLATVLTTMALDGRGVAWLPASLIDQALAQARLVRAGDARWAIDVEVRLFRPAAAQAPVAEKFWHAVARAAPVSG
jgi:DNA-binding transcriptional LysR family regulator